MNLSLEPPAGLVYSFDMTLQARNRIFRGGILISALSLVLVLGGSIAAYQFFPLAAAESTIRPAGLIQSLISGRFDISPYVPLASSAAAVFFSVVTISIIRYYFEKTQSEEIFYIGLFVLSLAVECVRIMVPVKYTLSLPGFYLFMSARSLIFGRCFGIFSLFAASLCAAGLKVQKQRTLVIAAITIAMIIAFGVPVDGLSWDSTLNMQSGYNTMFRLVEMGLVVITVLSFLIAAYTRSTKEFVYIALGVLLILTGRNILLGSDTWISPGPGFFILCAGTWLVCRMLHKVYLWI